MKSTPIIALSLFLAWTSAGIGIADNPSIVQANIPSDQWEQETNGIEVAMTLTCPAEKNIHQDTLRVYVKNISNNQFRFDSNEGDFGVRIFYVNGNGVEVALHEYKKRSYHLSKMLPIVIDPGATLLIKINVPSNEIPLLTRNMSRCSFDISDVSSGQKYTIESSPRQLTETFETSPTE